MENDYFAIPMSFRIGKENVIISRMLDNSMRPLLKKNDKFLVEILNSEKIEVNNKICFCILDDVFKVVIIEIKKNHIELRPLNKKYPTKIITRDQSKEQFKIIGLVKYTFKLVENYYNGEN